MTDICFTLTQAEKALDLLKSEFPDVPVENKFDLAHTFSLCLSPALSRFRELTKLIETHAENKDALATIKYLLDQLVNPHSSGISSSQIGGMTSSLPIALSNKTIVSVQDIGHHGTTSLSQKRRLSDSSDSEASDHKNIRVTHQDDKEVFVNNIEDTQLFITSLSPTGRAFMACVCEPDETKYELAVLSYHNQLFRHKTRPHPIISLPIFLCGRHLKNSLDYRNDELKPFVVRDILGTTEFPREFFKMSLDFIESIKPALIRAIDSMDFKINPNFTFHTLGGSQEICNILNEREANIINQKSWLKSTLSDVCEIGERLAMEDALLQVLRARASSTHTVICAGKLIKDYLRKGTNPKEIERCLKSLFTRSEALALYLSSTLHSLCANGEKWSRLEDLLRSSLYLDLSSYFRPLMEVNLRVLLNLICLIQKVSPSNANKETVYFKQ